MRSGAMHAGSRSLVIFLSERAVRNGAMRVGSRFLTIFLLGPSGEKRCNACRFTFPCYFYFRTERASGEKRRYMPVRVLFIFFLSYICRPGRN